ncbi:hypothetical protein BFR57_07355 [Idiomarina sp. MD25a]|uniref:DUF4199 domain-containing protein n=1 Tax=Idiomarina sp. MD25a TaxID=1889913 RepID=UPI0008F819B4|nr:DUF4199 domain-containing protein [Idiomarina sp. MD25a]OIN01865.1 hypothetical protein BFR57_07355 [Idiomarina sp. MD25a]
MKELKWGIIFSIAMLLWLTVERLTGLHHQNIEYHFFLTNIFAIIAIAIYVLALRDKKQSLPEQKMTWLTGFISGVKLTLVVAILAPLVQLIFHTTISPEFFDNMRHHAVTSGMMSHMRAQEYFTLTAYIFQAIIGAIGLGLITSAIVAFFLRSKDQ